MESAISSMLVQSGTESTPAAPSAAQAAAAAPAGTNAQVEGADAPDEDENKPAAEAAAQNEQAGDDAGEQDTPADQGEATDGQADQGDDALPPIEPPTSWSTEEKAEWKALSRKAQEAISRREQDLTKALRTAQNSTAEHTKAAEAEVTRLKGLALQVDSIVNRDIADLAREFPEIKSEADAVSLATSDPARYTAFRAKLDALQMVANTRAAAQQEVTKAEQKVQTELLTKAKDALIEAFPTWKEADVARRESTELQDYVVKAYGVDESTARSTIDPVIYRLAQKAMLYDRAQAKVTAAIKRDPPRVVKPGTQDATPRQTAKENTRRSQLDRLTKTGDIKDALGLMFE
jgi:hypothetical protein